MCNRQQNAIVSHSSFSYYLPLLVAPIKRCGASLHKLLGFLIGFLRVYYTKGLNAIVSSSYLRFPFVYLCFCYKKASMPFFSFFFGFIFLSLLFFILFCLSHFLSLHFFPSFYLFMSLCLSTSLYLLLSLLVS
jgi:hypothetical protein